METTKKKVLNLAEKLGITVSEPRDNRIELSGLRPCKTYIAALRVLEQEEIRRNEESKSISSVKTEESIKEYTKKQNPTQQRKERTVKRKQRTEAELLKEQQNKRVAAFRDVRKAANAVYPELIKRELSKISEELGIDIVALPNNRYNVTIENTTRKNLKPIQVYERIFEYKQHKLRIANLE